MTPKKTLLIILFIIGFSFILFSTFMFVSTIPKIDDELKTKEMEYLMYLEEWSRYHQVKIAASIIDNQLILLSEINPNNAPALAKMDKERVSFMSGAILHFYVCMSNEFPDDATWNKWISLDYAGVCEEYSKLYDELVGSKENSGYGSQILESINELNGEKERILLWSTIFQILGLSINQVAIILSIAWKRY